MTTKKPRTQPVKEALPPVRAVHRAIDILDYLGEHGAASLQQLHAGTGISKGALRRLLATLVDRRFIRTGITDHIYSTNVSAPLAINSQAVIRIGHLVEVAQPLMVGLTQRVRWPSSLHIYNRGRMHIIESTHGMSSYGAPPRLPPNAELNIFGSASGLAVLASMGDDFALQVIDEMKNEEFWSLSRFRISPARLLEELRDIRRKGYAKRRPSQGKLSNRNSIAVTIFDGKEATAAITLNWHRKAASAEAFAAQHLGELQAVAKAISRGLAEK